MTKTCKSNRDKIEIRELQKLVRRKVREDIRRYDERKIVNIIEDSWSTRKVKKELNQGRTMINKMKDKNGKLVKDREGILQMVTEFHEDLHGGKAILKMEESKEKYEKNIETIPHILNKEVEKVIDNLKNNKATGPDNVENEKLR